MPGDPLELIAVEVTANLETLDTKMQGASRVVDVHAQKITQSVQRTEQAIVQSSERSGAAMERSGGTARLLGQQFSQMGQQVAAGTSPLQALAIQLPDLAVVMGQTQAQAGSLAAFFAGPWGLALTTAASVALALGAGIMEADDKTKKTEGTHRDLVDVLRDSTASYDELTRASDDYRKQNEITRRSTLETMAVEAAAISNRLKLAIATRQLLNAELDRRKQEVSNSSIFAPQGYQQGLIARESAVGNVIAKNEKAISDLQRSAENVTTRIVDRLATVRSDPTEKISEGFEILRQRARATITDVGKLTDRLAQLNKAEDRALEKQRASDRSPGRTRSPRSAGKTEAERAAEAAAKAAERLDQQYAKTKEQLELEGRLAEIRGRGTEEAARTADIMEAQARIAAQFPELDAARLKILQDIAAININAAYDRKAEKAQVEQSLDDLKKVQDARKKAADELNRKQEQQIYTLANLYEDAFRGGTKAIWQDFKDMGLRIVAEVLARFAVAKLNGQSFDLGSAIGSAVGSVLPGFATGGSMRIGGRGGTDNNTLSMNGRPIARVSAGEELSIVNPNLSGGGSRGAPVINQTFVLDARGGITTPELLQYVNDTARQNATQASGAAYAAGQQSTPGTLNKFTQLRV